MAPPRRPPLAAAAATAVVLLTAAAVVFPRRVEGVADTAASAPYQPTVSHVDAAAVAAGRDSGGGGGGGGGDGSGGGGRGGGGNRSSQDLPTAERSEGAEGLARLRGVEGVADTAASAPYQPTVSHVDAAALAAGRGGGSGGSAQDVSTASRTEAVALPHHIDGLRGVEGVADTAASAPYQPTVSHVDAAALAAGRGGGGGGSAQDVSTPSRTKAVALPHHIDGAHMAASAPSQPTVSHADAAVLATGRAGSTRDLPTAARASAVAAAGVMVAPPQTCDAEGVCTEGDAQTPDNVVPSVPVGASAISEPDATATDDGDEEEEEEDDEGLMVGTPLSVSAPVDAAAAGTPCGSKTGGAAKLCFGVAFQEKINALRASATRPPLAYNKLITKHATAWSRTLRGRGALQRADLSALVGPPGTYVSAQNLALVPASADDPVTAAVDAWAARAGNRALMLGGATHMGVGVVRHRRGWWVSLFLATCFESDTDRCPADQSGATLRGGSGGGGSGGGGGGDENDAVQLAPDFNHPWMAMCKVNSCMRSGGDQACWYVGETTCADFASRIGCDDRFCEADVPPAPVCGSNGVTYDTECLADVASCQQGFAFSIAKWEAC